ncbi:MAG: hypothetical protein IPG00_11945 [Saprospiraceae bacterium]|nr:hypothetical protein [Saprospiraceae bacterium]
MGNVISIHAEIFVKRDETGQTIRPAEALWNLTKTYNGSSYNGYPMIIKEVGAYNDYSIRISYGEKYVPRSIFSFYEENKNFIDTIFVRTNYESNELDHIFELPSNNHNFEEIRRICRYGFDELLFKQRGNLELDSKVYKEYDGYRSIKLNGSMNSVSCLIDIDEKDIISFPIEYDRSLKTNALNDFETENKNLLNQIIDNSWDVVFKYKNVTVHRKIDTNEHLKQGFPKSPSDFMAIKLNNGKYDINSSGWYNCVDENYLNYLIKIKRIPPHNNVHDDHVG